MSKRMLRHVQWEYTSVTAKTFDIDELLRGLNTAGSLGWEVVAVAAVDPTIGLNRFTAILKRPAGDWPAPDVREPGWYDDPTGRHTIREWDGMRWTEHVHDAGVGGGVDYPNHR